MKYIIKILCCFIPKSSWRKTARKKLYCGYEKLCDRCLYLLSLIMPLKWKLFFAGNFKMYFSVSDYEKIQKTYPKILNRLRTKVKNGQKIRVGFIMHALESWTAEAVLLKMIANPSFEVSVVVVPSLVHTPEKEIELYHKTLQAVLEKYAHKIKVYQGLEKITMGGVLKLRIITSVLTSFLFPQMMKI